MRSLLQTVVIAGAVALFLRAIPARAQAESGGIARPDNAVTSDSVTLAMDNPGVMRLQKFYAENGVTTGQMERLREIDARAHAMRRFAKADDIAAIRAARAEILSQQQMEEVARAAASDFRVRLAARTEAATTATETGKSADAATTGTESVASESKDDSATTAVGTSKSAGTSDDPATTRAAKRSRK